MNVMRPWMRAISAWFYGEIIVTIGLGVLIAVSIFATMKYVRIL
jgi:hypothetical protein